MGWQQKIPVLSLSFQPSVNTTKFYHCRGWKWGCENHTTTMEVHLSPCQTENFWDAPTRHGIPQCGTKSYWVSPPYVTRCAREHRKIHHLCSQGTGGDSLWGCSSPTCLYSSNPWNFVYPMHPMAAMHLLSSSHMIKQCHIHLWACYKCKENSYQCEQSLHTL